MGKDYLVSEHRASANVRIMPAGNFGHGAVILQRKIKNKFRLVSERTDIKSYFIISLKIVVTSE